MSKTVFTIVLEKKKERSLVVCDLISKRRYGHVIQDKKKYSRKEKHKKDYQGGNYD